MNVSREMLIKVGGTDLGKIDTLILVPEVDVPSKFFFNL